MAMAYIFIEIDNSKKRTYSLIDRILGDNEKEVPVLLDVFFLYSMEIFFTFDIENKIRESEMIAQLKSEQNFCPHCWGKKICDCASCGQKVRHISFGGKWFKYYESGRCKACGGKGVVLDID